MNKGDDRNEQEVERLLAALKGALEESARSVAAACIEAGIHPMAVFGFDVEGQLVILPHPTHMDLIADWADEHLDVLRDLRDRLRTRIMEIMEDGNPERN